MNVLCKRGLFREAKLIKVLSWNSLRVSSRMCRAERQVIKANLSNWFLEQIDEDTVARVNGSLQVDSLWLARVHLTIFFMTAK